MGEQLADRITPIDPTALASAFVAAWRKLFGETPRRETICTLMAQSALETGRWKYCHNFNIGNVKSSPADGRDFAFFRCNEVINGRTVWFDPPHPQTRFRAFKSLEAGVVDHLAFLHGLQRYVAAWQFVKAGDAGSFVQALSAGGYFTAAVEPYMRSVRSLFAEFLKLPFDIDAEPDPINEEVRRETMALVSLNLRDIALRETERPETDEDEEPNA